MATKKSRKGGIKLDFEGVESGGGRAVKDGIYGATIDKAEEGESDQGNPVLNLQYKLKNGARLYDNLSLLPQALWKLKTLLEVTGMDVPDGEMELDVADLIAKKGKSKKKDEDEDDDDADDSDDSDDDDDDDDKPAKGKSKGKPVKAAPKFKTGQKVSFVGEKGKTVRGVINEIDGDTAKVEDKGGDEWEVELDDLTAL
jgi:hypothetical protein